MSAVESAAEWVWLARIRRPQGRKGEVFAEILTDFPGKFNERRRLWLVEGDASPRRTAAPAGLPRQVELRAHWPHKGGVVLHFEGVDSISAAEQLTGLAVAIPRAERAALESGEAYVSDLIGCTLFDVAGGEPGKDPVLVGEIEDVDRSAGPVPLLVVRGATGERGPKGERGPRSEKEGSETAGGEILIPWAKDYLRRIDLEARRVEMALPEGLINLNAPEAG